MSTTHLPDQSSGASGNTGLDHDEFERQVQDALGHLHDPVHLQTHPLSRFVRPALAASDLTRSAGAGPASRSPSFGRALGQALLEAIDALSPGNAPASHRSAPRVAVPGAPLPRPHQILRLRFVETLEVPEILDRLAISRSSYYVDQQRAVKAVADLLWERWVERGGDDGPRFSQEGVQGLPEAARRHNLPIQLTSFVGREREIADVRQLLETARLLTLTGIGGGGKTRLALEVASDMAGEFRDGAWLVELASLSDPGLLPRAVAFALGLRGEAECSATDTLVAHLRPRHLLLVLDNCEHLLLACARLAETLLTSCPELTILTTSREVLAIGGETRYLVPLLAVPPPERWSDTAVAAEYESVHLFVERAKAVRPAFRLTAENAPAVAEICWRLDGIPLAVELAAARVRVLSVEQIAQRLDDRFRLLTGGTRTAVPRHQALRATMDWSHDLLCPAARTLFQRLAVFAGGWNLEAAEAVCGDWSTAGEPGEKVVGRDDVLDLLTQLVDRSLVLVEEVEGEARFRFLETIRQYAAERLAQGGEQPEVCQRHFDWCLAFARRAEPELFGPDQVSWFERLEREHDNVRAALRWSQTQSDGAPEVELSAALVLFWRFRHIEEGRRWLGHAVGRGVCGSPKLRAKLLCWAGHLDCLYGGDWEKASTMLEEALALSREIGDGAGVSCALRHLSLIAVARGGIVAALPLYETAVLEAHRSSDQREIRFSLLLLGYTAYESGDRARGRSLVEEGLANCRTYQDWTVMCYGLAYLASIALQEGDTPLARRMLEERLVLARAMKSRVMVADTLGALGDVARIEGDLETARAHLRESLVRVRDTGERLYIISWLERCAALEAILGNADRAARLFGAAQAVSERTGASGTVVTLLALPRIQYGSERVAVQQALGEPRFAVEWETGRELTLDEAVAFALEVG